MVARMPLLAMLPLLLAALAVLIAAAASTHHPHPLDPLSPAELTAVRHAVLASPLLPARPLTFHYVGLDEPDKPDVISYAYAEADSSSSRAALPRRAFVIARAGGQSHELRVDVADPAAPAVLSHAVHRGTGLPILTLDEQFAAVALPPRHPPFVESVRAPARRGHGRRPLRRVPRRVVRRPLGGGGRPRPAEGGQAAVLRGRGDGQLLRAAAGGHNASGGPRPDGHRRVQGQGAVPGAQGRGDGLPGRQGRAAVRRQSAGARRGGAAGGQGLPHRRPLRQVGQLGVPRGLRRASRHGHLTGLHPRRRHRRAAAGALPRVRVGGLRAVHGPGRGVVLPHVPGRRRVRPGALGLPAPARRRLPGQRRLPGRLLRWPGRQARGEQEHDLHLRTLRRRRRLAPHRGRLPRPPDHGGPAGRELGCEDGRVLRQLRLHLGLGVQDQRLHQIHGVSHRPPGGEGDGLHARRPDHAGRARHAGGGEHARRLPRPLRHVPPGPRRRRHQQLLRQEHRRHQAQRGRHAEEELLDGAPGGGRDRGGRAGGRERRAAGRPAGRQPQQAHQDGQRDRVPGRPGRRDGGVGAGRRRLPAEARQLQQEAGAGDAVQQGGEVGARAVRRPEHRRRQPGRLEREGQGGTERGHRAVVHGGHPPHTLPGRLPGHAHGERRVRAPAGQLLREEPVAHNETARA